LSGKNESSERIRPLALAIIRKEDRILLLKGRDSFKNETFYRPLGGGIEFGETGQRALIREIREELDAEITDIEFIGALENLFTYEGKPGHEIVLIYKAELADRTLYEKAFIEGHEDDNSDFKAEWKSLSDFADGKPPLYPDGLLELLLGK